MLKDCYLEGLPQNSPCPKFRSLPVRPPELNLGTDILGNMTYMLLEIFPLLPKFLTGRTINHLRIKE